MGRATISSAAGDGIFAWNVAGIEISDLVVRGNGNTAGSSNGIHLYSDLPGNVKLAHVRITNVEVSLYARYGVVIGSWNQSAPYGGFTDVRMERMVAHDNGEAGVPSYGYAPSGTVTRTAWPHANISVRNSRLYNNRGVPTLAPYVSLSAGSPSRGEGLNLSSTF